MPKLNMKNVEDAEGFSPAPAGDYLCELIKVEEASTNAGDEMWKLRWEIIEGQSKGKKIFDNMVFSDNAMKRVKLILSRLGLDVSGEIDLVPETILRKRAIVTVEIESYSDDEGREKRRNVVPFGGYERADRAPAAAGPGPGKAPAKTSAPAGEKKPTPVSRTSGGKPTGAPPQQYDDGDTPF